MRVSDQAVEAGARVIADICCEPVSEWHVADARRILEAAVPFLVAGVLEDEEAVERGALALYGPAGASALREPRHREISQVLRAVLGVEEERRRCPDDGACHHHCGKGPCWRVKNAAPLAASGWDDWPLDVLGVEEAEG